MAIDFSGLSTTDNYSTAFIPKINEAIKGSCVLLDPAYISYTGTPYTGAKRLASGGVFEQFNGSSWAELATGYAKLASPALTGAPTAPAAAIDTTTSQLATCAWYMSQAGQTNPAANGAAAPGASKRWARQDHVHPTDTSRAALSSPTFTGTPSAPTPSAGDATTRLATTAFVGAALGAYAPKASPAFTGTAVFNAANTEFKSDEATVLFKDSAGVQGGYVKYSKTSAGLFFDAIGVGKRHEMRTNGVARLRVLDNAVQVMRAAYTPAVAVAYAAGITIDAATGNVFHVGTLAGNVASMSIGGAGEGQFITLRFTQDATGGRTVALPGGAAVAGSPALGGGKVSYLALTYNSSKARWEGAWTAIP